jgi:hypothetical protein
MVTERATEATAGWRLMLPWLLVCVVVAMSLLPGLIEGDRAVSPDSERYLELGNRLYRGDGFTNSDGSPHVFTPPVYPLLAGSGEAALLLMQGVLFLLTCLCLYRLLIRCSVSITSAKGTTLLFALSPLPLLYTGRILSETVFLFILLTGINLLFASLAARPVPQRMRYQSAIGGGILIGLAALTRAVLLPWLCLWPLMIIFRRKERFVLTLALAGVLLPVGGWSARNLHQFNVFAPNPATATTHYCATLAAPGTAYSQALVEQRGERPLENPFAEAAAGRQAALRLVRSHPGQFCVGLIKSLPLLVAPPLPELLRGFGMWERPTGVVSRIHEDGWLRTLKRLGGQAATQVNGATEQGSRGAVMLVGAVLLALWDVMITICGLIGLLQILRGKRCGSDGFYWVFFGSLCLVLLLAPAGVYQPRFRAPVSPMMAVLAYPVILLFLRKLNLIESTKVL